MNYCNDWKPALLSLLALTFASSSLAAGGSGSGMEGHGGTAMFCNDVRGHLVRKEMLDLYEGENEWELKLPKSPEKDFPKSSKKKADIALLLIERAMKRFEVVPGAKKGIQEALDVLRTQISPWVEGDPSMVTQDYISLLPGERCRRVQIGRRDIDKKSLKVRFDELDRLDTLSQAAFWVHEAVYEWMWNEFKISTSDIPRVVTALAFAEENRGDDLRELLTDPKRPDVKYSRYRTAALREMLSLNLLMEDPNDPAWGQPEETDISVAGRSKVIIRVALNVDDPNAANGICSGLVAYLYDERGEKVETLIDTERNPVMQCLGGNRAGEIEISDPSKLAGRTLAIVFERASLVARSLPVSLQVQVTQEFENSNRNDLLKTSQTISSSAGEIRKSVKKFRFRPLAD